MMWCCFRTQCAAASVAHTHPHITAQELLQGSLAQLAVLQLCWGGKADRLWIMLFASSFRDLELS